MTIREKLCLHKDEIVSRYEYGESTASLGRWMGCNGGYVWTMLKEWGVELRQYKQVEPNSEAILALHAQGKSAYAINKELGLKKNTAERALARAGIDISARQWKREDPLVNHRDAIVARYLAGEGCDLIAADYHCQRSNIMRLLKRAGVQMRTVRDYAYSVDESFFDTIDTEQKAYALGFWMADGCNMTQVPCVQLAIADRDILVAISEAMSYRGPIQAVAPRGKGKLPLHVLAVGSRRMSEALERLGCVRGKTYTATFPSDDQVPIELHSHLVRGWLDGDGTIVRKQPRHQASEWHSRIVGTESACRGLSATCSRHLGFSGSVCAVHKGKTHTTWAFTVSGRNQLKSYLDWLYRDATIFLARKRAKYEEFLASCP